MARTLEELKKEMLPADVAWAEAKTAKMVKEIIDNRRQRKNCNATASDGTERAAAPLP